MVVLIILECSSGKGTRRSRNQWFTKRSDFSLNHGQAFSEWRLWEGTGKTIQWRGFGHSANRRTLKLEIFCAHPLSKPQLQFLTIWGIEARGSRPPYRALSAHPHAAERNPVPRKDPQLGSLKRDFGPTFRNVSASPKPHPSKPHPCNNMTQAKTEVALQFLECCAAEATLKHSLFCSADVICTKSCAATNEKLHCNIEIAALQESGAFLLLSCGFQAPTFRHPRFGLAERCLSMRL